MVTTLKTVNVMIFLQNIQLILAPKKLLTFHSLSLEQNLEVSIPPFFCLLVFSFHLGVCWKQDSIIIATVGSLIITTTTNSCKLTGDSGVKYSFFWNKLPFFH